MPKDPVDLISFFAFCGVFLTLLGIGFRWLFRAGRNVESLKTWSGKRVILLGLGTACLSLVTCVFSLLVALSVGMSKTEISGPEKAIAAIYRRSLLGLHSRHAFHMDCSQVG